MSGPLQADRLHIAEIEAQILDLERSLYALRAEKTLVQERLDSYKYPFPPDYPACPPLTGLLSPTTLLLICRKWRQLALTTPALWSALLLTNYRISFERLAHIADFWLERSSCCPLSISIEEYDDGCDRDFLPLILSSLVSHRARWEHLKLRIFRPLPPAIAGSMPLLRHLDLTLDTTTRFAITRTPLLRTLVLNSDAASCAILPWVLVTSLALCSICPNDCVPILQKTTNLVHFELSIPGGNAKGQLPAYILRPSLQHFVLKNPYDRIVTPFLNIFDFPALRSLSIPESFLGENPIDSLTSFISKSGCSLQELCITGQITAISAASYRQAFPAISKFSFPEQL
ncbi:hypothetical protein B0H13DRAFT_2675838 [Mycena leptocephala]|nr:hypothetical protein B0H13DRAFT_2675838 [Mycena leptocephala]